MAPPEKPATRDAARGAFPDGFEVPTYPHAPGSEEEEDFWWKRGLWQQPRQVVYWDHTIEGVHSKGVAEPGRKVSWSELFFDLVLVTNVAKLGEAYQEGHVGIFQLFLLYRVLFDNWVTVTTYSCRFFTDDVSAKLIMGALMFTLVMSGLRLDERFSESAANFCYFSAIFHVVQLVPNIRAYKHIPQLREHIFREGIALGAFKAAVLFGASFVESETGVCGLLIFLVVGNLCWGALVFGFFPLPKAKRGPIHVDHIIERRGCLRLIVMGEVITGVTISASEVDVMTVGLVLLGFLLVFNMKLLAFDVDIVPIHRHAYRLGGVVRIYTFFEMATVFEAAMALMGSCIRIVLSILLTDETEPDYVHAESAHLLLCACVSVGIAALTIERFTHEQEHAFFGKGEVLPSSSSRNTEQDRLVPAVPQPHVALYGAISDADDPEGELDDYGRLPGDPPCDEVKFKKLGRQIWLLQIATHVVAVAAAAGLGIFCLHIHENFEFLMVLAGLWLITSVCIVVDLLDEYLLY